MNFGRRRQLTPEDEELKTQIKTLRMDISRLRRERQPRSQAWEACRQGRDFETPQALKLKKVISSKDGGEITNIDFGADNVLLALCAGAKSDGAVQLFDTTSDSAPLYVKLKNAWFLKAAIEKEQSRLFAAGGLDNMPVIYDIHNLEPETETNNGIVTMKPNVELHGHSSCVYQCKFTNPNELVSVGDSSVKIWDIDQGRCKTSFLGHTSDIFCVDVHPDASRNLFISGAGDFTVRLWDGDVQANNMRAQASLTFDTQARDVNDVAFFPNGQAFAAALNNSCCHLYDIRASTKILTLQHQQTFHRSAVEGVEFSASGRLVFLRYKNNSVLCYDLAGPTQDTTDGEVINDNILHEVFNQEQCESIAVAANGSVFGAAIKSPQRRLALAHLYWPNGKVRRR